MEEFRPMDEEALSIWQDILDQVANEKLEGHKCPYCSTGDLVCEKNDHLIKIHCPQCKKLLEGQLC